MKYLYISALLSLSLTCQANAASPYLEKVLDYRPAPGQFINEIPEYEEGDTEADIIRKAQESICSAKMPGMISLGAFGGYVVVAFDHPVVNVPGQYDFKLYGNSFYTDPTAASAEPGIVMVSVDENGNGLADDTWYELAGSAYRDPETIHNFSLTYYRPAADKVAEPDSDIPAIIDRTYIRYTTNQESKKEGYITRNTSHTQPYWPQWIKADTLTFTGTCLPNNVVTPATPTGNYVTKPFEWGYVDNEPNNTCKGFNIEWAVDAEGRPVALSKVDFIKVYTAECASAGRLGEESTEVTGGEDLHPDATPGSVCEVEAADFAFLGCYRGTLHLRASVPDRARIYTADGRLAETFTIEPGQNVVDMTHLPAGLYILKAAGCSRKFIR